MKHFSMKRNIFSKCLYAMMALGLLASCSNEPLLEDTPGGVIENETTAYIRISLMGEGLGSRADEAWAVDGEEGETTVKSLLLAFYDQNRNFVASQSVSMNNVNVTDEPGTGNTVEKIITFVTPVNLPGNINHPAWVVAFVNPTSAVRDLDVSLERLMNRTRLRENVSPDGYRTMNNSVYYDETTGNVRYATPVNFSDQFFNTYEEAQANKEKSIDITVERMEAKVKVNSFEDIENISAVPAKDKNDNYTLTFVPQAWFVNATEKRSFLLKNYRKSDWGNWNKTYETQTIIAKEYFWNFEDLKKTFGETEPFNKQTYLRSYWAIDPTYFSDDNIYPDISYDVKYDEIKDNVINDNANDYSLLYRSFNVALDEYNKKDPKNPYAKFNANRKTHEYVLENTMNKATLTGPNAMASMTAVELIGYYIVKKGTEVVFDGNPDGADYKTKYKGKAFYIRNEGSASAPSYKIMINDEEAINYFLEHATNMLYVQTLNEDGTPSGKYERLHAGHIDSNNNLEHKYGITYADFGLIYPDKKITTKEKLPEQWRTLTLNKTGVDESGNAIYNKNILITDGNSYRPIADSDMKKLATEFYTTFGAVERFCEGKAHFTVPLKHIWAPTSTSNSFDAGKVEVGHYGVVRNHIYDLTIKNITGLGSGIGDPEQPIVPPTNYQQFYISTKLNILKWRMVKQTVELK